MKKLALFTLVLFSIGEITGCRVSDGVRLPESKPTTSKPETTKPKTSTARTGVLLVAFGSAYPCAKSLRVFIDGDEAGTVELPGKLRIPLPAGRHDVALGSPGENISDINITVGKMSATINPIIGCKPLHASELTEMLDKDELESLGFAPSPVPASKPAKPPAAGKSKWNFGIDFRELPLLKDALVLAKKIGELRYHSPVKVKKAGDFYLAKLIKLAGGKKQSINISQRITTEPDSSRTVSIWT